jgi:hypothetical protein
MICIPSMVDFIWESALAAIALELIEFCELNAQFATSEHMLVGQRDAIAVRCFGGGD